MQEEIENLDKLMDSGDILSYHTENVEHLGKRLVFKFELIFPSGKVLTVDCTGYYSLASLDIKVE
jgi:hypothetical protein